MVRPGVMVRESLEREARRSRMGGQLDVVRDIVSMYWDHAEDYVLVEHEPHLEVYVFYFAPPPNYKRHGMPPSVQVQDDLRRVVSAGVMVHVRMVSPAIDRDALDTVVRLGDSHAVLAFLGCST